MRKSPLRGSLLSAILHTDPFERADYEFGAYDKWYVERVFVFAPAIAIVGQHLATFQQFPPRQAPGSSGRSGLEEAD